MIIVILMFTMIGFITTAKPSARISSQIFSVWTEHMDYSFFTMLYSMENHAFDLVYPVSDIKRSIPDRLLQVATSIRFQDLKSVLGIELPGFSTYENKVIIASETMNNLEYYTHESGPPLEIIMKDREAVDHTDPQESKEPAKEPSNTTGDKQVVFLYNSHNRESFMPHLPKETKSNNAFHKEVNVTKVSDYLKERLVAEGIGTEVDDTDIMQILNDKGWSYPKSYTASRPVVEAALKNNKDIQYIFDIHRDSLPRKKTTKKLEGKEYATILFVIGAENKNYEKNLKLATQLHQLIEKKYPGISKGVITKEGAGTNGVFNQDLFNNAILMEIGGFENTLEEMYQTTDIIAEVFSEYYWDAEKVNK